MRSPRQQELPFRRRGGARPGAGRKPRGPRALVSHKERPRFEKPTPLHVALRLPEPVWNLRRGRTHHSGETGVDRFSSAALAVDEREALRAPPLGWLLRWGWKRARPRSVTW